MDIDRLDRLAKFLDEEYSVGGHKFGWDGIIGLIPGVGDIVTSLISLYIVYVGYQEGARDYTILRMLLNILLELIVGSIPILGDAFDFFYKANVKNIAILRKELGPREI